MTARPRLAWAGLQPPPARSYILARADRRAITAHVVAFLRRLWTRAALRRQEVATFAFELALLVERADARVAAQARRALRPRRRGTR